jgi:hypothetical protein
MGMVKKGSVGAFQGGVFVADEMFVIGEDRVFDADTVVGFANAISPCMAAAVSAVVQDGFTLLVNGIGKTGVYFLLLIKALAEQGDFRGEELGAFVAVSMFRVVVDLRECLDGRIEAFFEEERFEGWEVLADEAEIGEPM